MIEEILPRIYRIHVPLAGSPLKALNSYLIQDDGRCLLIDTGFRHEVCEQALRAALDELGVRREETDVLLTHRHYDHTGLVDRFAGPNRHIYIGGLDLPALDTDSINILIEQQRLRFLREGFPPDALARSIQDNPGITQGPPSGLSNCVALREGDMLDIAGYQLRAISTPGHTPGHMCFWMEREDTMFLGDHVLFDITPNITFWPDHPDSLGAYLDSLKKISAYDVVLPLPGHRSSGPLKRRVSQLLSHHQQRLEETLRLIRATPGHSAYDIAGAMRWNIRAESWKAFPPTQKWFAVGECLAHLDHLLLTGEIAAVEESGILRYVSR